MRVASGWHGDMPPAYVARPEAAREPVAGVVVVQEVWGTDDHVLDVARRLAESGFVAVAPDLYALEGARRPELAAERIEEVKDFRDSIPHEAWMDESRRVAALAALEPHALGGRLALELAAVEPRLAAAVCFYGSPPAADLLERVRCPTLAIYGGSDAPVTARAPEVASALRARGVPFTGLVYPGAPHAFFNDTRTSYRARAAASAWAQTLAFLDEHTGASPEALTD